MLKLGNQSISAAYLGGMEVKKAYLGETVVFDKSAPPVSIYTISAAIDPAGSGTVSGTGSYPAGETVTIAAVPGDGYQFTGWQENGAVVSVDAEYTFTVAEDRALVAVFAAVKPSRLPEGYTEVEYVEADTGTSGFVITTGIRANTVVTAKFAVTQWPTGNTYKYLFYNIYSSEQRFLAVNSSKIWAYWGSSTSNAVTLSHTSAVPFEINMSVAGKKGTGGLNVNGTTGTSSGIQNVRSDTYIGGKSSSGSNGMIGMRIYYVNISSSTNTTSDFNAELIPCITPSGQAGLYDLANKKVYTASSGSWTPGPAV